MNLQYFYNPGIYAGDNRTNNSGFSPGNADKYFNLCHTSKYGYMQFGEQKQGTNFEATNLQQVSSHIVSNAKEKVVTLIQSMVMTNIYMYSCF